MSGCVDDENYTHTYTLETWNKLPSAVVCANTVHNIKECYEKNETQDETLRAWFSQEHTDQPMIILTPGGSNGVTLFLECNWYKVSIIILL